MESKKSAKFAEVKSDSSQRCKIISVSDLEADSETEIAAEISLPKEGGWGWVVVAGSFACIFILDGIFFTFSSIYKDITEDLNAEVSIVALTNSVAIALYFISGPIVSALINRFGFRSCTMTGSIIVSLAYFVAHFAQNSIVLILFYGIMSGFGGCFIYMSSQLIVGFYFERLRALAMGISGLGQSFGVSIMSFVNTYLVQLAGWRTTTLLHSGLFAAIYFIGMTYRPLVTLTVVQGTEESATINYLASLSRANVMTSGLLSDIDVTAPTAAERLFNAPSNAQFPTAAEMLEDSEDENDDELEPGPSSDVSKKIKITINNSQGTVTEKQLQQVKSMISKTSFINTDEKIEGMISSIQMDKRKWWKKCCRWENHIDEARPLYRDDAFYTGKLENLPVYRRSMLDARGEKTGLEYKMAVSRTVTAVDLKEKTGVFTHAVRRILATMMDPRLLKRPSFIMVCATGFFIHIGLLVPYVFLPDRNKREGIEQKHCDLFVSVIGLSNAMGKIIAGILGCKFNPVKLYGFACFMAGTGTIATNFSYNVYYQYFCCALFGVSAAHISTLRSLVIVELYGLDNLTNATGMLLMFQGFGTLISTPLSSILKKYFSYVLSFSVAGSFIILGSFLIWPVRTVIKKEAKAKQKVHLLSRKRSSMQRPTKKTDGFPSMPPIPEKRVS